MRRFLFITLLLFFLSPSVMAQIVTETSPCSHTAILNRHLALDSSSALAMSDNELFIQHFIDSLAHNRNETKAHDSTAQYIIPVVLHVFHHGDDGRIDMEQAQSGLDILNADMTGLNDDWDEVDPEFESIKAALDIQFCLASIDPEGNPTTGVIYYDDSLAMVHETTLNVHAWDNFKYLNIYLPKYVWGAPSLFTAYATYPNLALVESNGDGIFYSSIRWGYGSHSELEDGQEWASVITHETGHWLSLLHTFENGCSLPGDMVDDTPPTLGGEIFLEGCDNNDGSCAVSANGENYMDYNHDCKKMFTQGQVDRMTAALHLDARSNLWSTENLCETGCKTGFANLETENIHTLNIYPNPASTTLTFKFDRTPDQLIIFNAVGVRMLIKEKVTQTCLTDVSTFTPGVYFYQTYFEDGIEKGKFIIE